MLFYGPLAPDGNALTRPHLGLALARIALTLNSGPIFTPPAYGAGNGDTINTRMDMIRARVHRHSRAAAAFSAKIRRSLRRCHPLG